ncbi:hypothetical protein HDE76_003780 [Rhodanobacter sp. ANJX3]|uniref:hypothetical protein n=1 Tax=Rhodanobacter sp. ANJX3 TaxID=2723083 RepID=UPI00161D9E6B|nr:hypothetical protein [Rhodanobacter sp. ANJX3]MBB5360536.1 hypothetical protein [Rhodanobacter sp. ANJX3]
MPEVDLSLVELIWMLLALVEKALWETTWALISRYADEGLGPAAVIVIKLRSTAQALLEPNLSTKRRKPAW